MGEIHLLEILRERAGVVTEFPRSFLGLLGRDRAAFLHQVVSHDIKGLIPGQAREALLLDRHGKIQAWLLCHAQPDRLLLEMDPGDFDRALDHLQRLKISESVEFEDLRLAFRMVPVLGPEAGKFLKTIFPGIILPASAFLHQPGPAELGISWILRWDLFGVPGYHLGVLPNRETALRETLTARGRSLGLTEISPETLEILRIEAGLPWPGHEMTEQVIANELERESLVSFTKGCFIGQEIVARIKYRAHPPRVLRGFLLEGSGLPPVPTDLLYQGKPVGTLTSAAVSPPLNQGIGLGFLQWGALESSLTVLAGGKEMGLRVARLPLVSPTAGSSLPS